MTTLYRLAGFTMILLPVYSALHYLTASWWQPILWMAGLAIWYTAAIALARS